MVKTKAWIGSVKQRKCHEDTAMAYMDNSLKEFCYKGLYRNGTVVKRGYGVLKYFCIKMREEYSMYICWWDDLEGKKNDDGENYRSKINDY